MGSTGRAAAIRCRYRVRGKPHVRRTLLPVTAFNQRATSNGLSRGTIEMENRLHALLGHSCLLGIRDGTLPLKSALPLEGRGAETAICGRLPRATMDISARAI
jgi:hypothetical protein